MVTKIGIDSSASCQACLSTLIQTGTTIGDLVHAGKANDFVRVMENTLKDITQYENLYRHMAEQFNPLSPGGIHTSHLENFIILEFLRILEKYFQ